MSHEAKDWLRNINISTLVTVAVLVGGWVVFFATQRAELNDHDRRIVWLEANIVPRPEHAAKDAVEQQKERLLDERLTNIEHRLDQLIEMRSSGK